MKRLSFRQRLLMGVTLFSMFFGAGNLIFPPFTGYCAGADAVPAFLGLISTAVLFPVLGIAATARAGGMDGLCSKVHPQFSKWFTLIIYLCIGPMLAIPRTASMAFSMMRFATASAASVAIGPFTLEQVLAVVFSVLFFAASRFFAKRPSHLKDILGKILTPLLLVLVVVLFAGGMFLLPAEAGAARAPYAGAPFAAGFVEGYNTMDALAAMVFGILIAVNIQDFGLEDAKQLRVETSISGLLAGVVLTIVYGMLAILGARASAVLPEASDGSVVLSELCRLFFGNAGAVLLAVIFLVACFNVCTGLLSSCASFFSKEFPRLSFAAWLNVFTVSGCVISVFGLGFILQISVPILTLIYPVALTIIVLNLFPFAFLQKPWVHRIAVIAAFAYSVISML